jgi:hypothetical protein
MLSKIQRHQVHGAYADALSAVQTGIRGRGLLVEGFRKTEDGIRALGDGNGNIPLSKSHHRAAQDYLFGLLGKAAAEIDKL